MEYLRLDDEVKRNQLAHAITLAFQRTPRSVSQEEEEEVIDTTKPEFARHFKGFINTANPNGVKPGRSQMFGGNNEIRYG